MRIKMRYFVKSFLTAIMVTGIVLLFFHYTKVPQASVNEITKNILDISISFSLTLTGFSFASFSVLQLIQGKDWFNRVSKSNAYVSFISRLIFLIVFALIQFCLSLIFIFIYSIFLELNIFICSVSAFCFGFIICWLIDCIIDYIKIIN